MTGGAAPAGSAMTARRAPRRSSSARIGRPDRRDATDGGITRTARPRGLQVRQAVLDPGELGLPLRRQPVDPPAVVLELLEAPAPHVEGRVADERVRGGAGEGVGTDRVADADLGRAGSERQPGGGERGETGIDLLPEHPDVVRDRAEHRPGAARRIQHGAGRGVRQLHHQRRELGDVVASCRECRLGEPAEQPLVRLLGAGVGDEFVERTPERVVERRVRAAHREVAPG